jgi:hypothetical protein
MDALGSFGFALLGIVLAAVCFTAFFYGILGKTLRQQERRLRVLDRRLRLVMDRLGVEDPPPPEVAQLLGRATGADLEEARDAVDALARAGGG